MIEYIKKVTFICAMLMLVCYMGITAKAESKIIGNVNFVYTVTSKTVWITEIELLSNKGISTVKIPTKIEGKPVVKLGSMEDKDRWYDANNLFGLSMTDDCNDDGEKLPAGTWLLVPEKEAKKVAKVKEIVIPDTVQEITPNCFADIQDGKIINIPKGVTKNVVQLCGIKWKEFIMSPDNKKYKVQNGLLLSKDGEEVYGSVIPLKNVKIPRGVKQIKKKSNFDSEVTTDFYIPASLDKIGYESLHMSNPVDFHISEKNPHYAAADGCIYSKKTGRLVAVSSKNSIFRIPKQVTFLEDTDFSGEEVKEFVIPKTVKKIASFWCPFNEDITYVFEGKIPPIIEKSFAVEEVKFIVPKGCTEIYQRAVKGTESMYGGGMYGVVVKIHEVEGNKYLKEDQKKSKVDKQKVIKEGNKGEVTTTKFGVRECVLIALALVILPLTYCIIWKCLQRKKAKNLEFKE